jgi:protein-L-isoaspartate(D-aspartate) O-methyltransferase
MIQTSLALELYCFGMAKENLDKVFREVERSNFLREEYKKDSDLDVPLSIGYGQTISQPYTVRVMLEWLDAKPGNKVLDVGSGSGWTTALLSKIVGPEGVVYAVEKIPDLVHFGQQNCQRLGSKNAVFYEAGPVLGLPSEAPYERILVSAASAELPEELTSQLRIGGKMVIPVKQTILEITKVSENNYLTIEHPGFVFVPLLYSSTPTKQPEKG